ncbi:MAG: hypothetical protein EAZ17_02190 [Sphingobacteriales bacterium]|nr:MAG: hypothetical protein EAZ17_02190 [Sphingobacteriales bacterium]
MDLDKIWGELGKEPVEGGLIKGQQQLKDVKSLHPLIEVRNNLRITNIWGIVISIGYIVLMIFYPYWQVILGFSIVLTFNIVFIFQGIRLRKQLPLSVDAGHSMLHEMKVHHAAVTQWIENQMYAARFVFPVAAASGFMMGGIWGSGKCLGQLFTKPIFPISMIISAVLFSFAGIWLARKMFGISYQKFLDRLKVNIDQLESQRSTEIT